MILVDPDLDPDPALKTASATRGAARGAHKKSSELKLPSARSLARFLKAAQEAVRLKGQVTVLLTTDAAIRDLNRRFRGKNKATDVLSFPAEGPIPGSSAEGIAGDIAISVTTALRQAEGQGHSLATEIKVLVLHGVLHLAGFDHEADAGQMARRERVLRGRLGLPMGLIERADAEAFPQGLKPRTLFGQSSARLKSCPDTKLSSASARLKTRPFKASKQQAKANAAVKDKPRARAKSAAKGKRP
jgi:probable rRNA maturation factor